MEAIHPYALWLIAIFVIGYTFITFEHVAKINKATVALFTAVILWTLIFIAKGMEPAGIATIFYEELANISQVVFFLLGALTVVEIVQAHDGFRIVSNVIRAKSKRSLLWLVGGIAFFLSSILDNLTTTIVMLTILRTVIPARRERLLFGGAVVIAANAGGAWTPIGDVTTTMLWIGGQLTTFTMMKELLLPSSLCLVISCTLLSLPLKGHFPPKELLPENSSTGTKAILDPLGPLFFFLGIGLLISVPIFKIVTGMPPFMGMLFALSILWIITDLLHSSYADRHHLRVPHILSRIDLSGTLFFLGILLAVSALGAAGLLTALAHWFDTAIGNTTIIAILIGLASAIVDNVPLVAATMGMYDTAIYPVDAPFWQLIAYCAGTGGSILVVGSAAGVVFMGIEKVDFFWYLRHISLSALIGYLAGALLYAL